MSDPDDLTDATGHVLTIQADSADSALAWATLGMRRWRCVVGAGGVREDKVEGDAATPAAAALFPQRPPGAAQGALAGAADRRA
jgi:L,D-peptidoglycan transpeptidase YkuD (ErfK/YbiS/YcfS/YnhG family)